MCTVYTSEASLTDIEVVSQGSGDVISLPESHLLGLELELPLVLLLARLLQLVVVLAAFLRHRQNNRKTRD